MEATLEDRIVKALREGPTNVRVRKIVLFGSSATKEPIPGQDLDLALVVEKPIGFSNYDERLVLKARFRKQLAQINEEMPIDLLVYTEEEYQSSLTEGGFIQKEVEEPGRVLYEEVS